MRSVPFLLTVSVVSVMTMAACAQPFSIETGDGQTDQSTSGQSPAATSGTTTPPASTATPTTPPATTGLCGTNAAAITYTGQAATVIKSECAPCHSGGTAPLLTDYASSKTGFTNGGSQAVAAGSMPLGLTLTENQKCILTQWATNNYAQ